jgi:hypothetical protein
VWAPCHVCSEAGRNLQPRTYDISFFTYNFGCGVKRYKGGTVRKENILWIFYLLFSGELAKIQICFLLESDFESVVK